jgi:hypothetical protein
MKIGDRVIIKIFHEDYGEIESEGVIEDLIDWTRVKIYIDNINGDLSRSEARLKDLGQLPLRLSWVV